MNRRSLPLTPILLALVASATYMAALIKLPWYGFAGWVIMGGSVVAAKVAPAKCAALWKLGWAATALVLVSVLFNRLALDDYHAVLAGQMALAIFLAAEPLAAGGPKSNWKILGMTWAFIGGSICLGVSYAKNLPGEFCLGLLINLFLLVLCRVWFRPGGLGIQVLNTLILLLIVLPTTDIVLRLKLEHDMNSDPTRYFSYAEAGKNRAAFARWTRYYDDEWLRLAAQVMKPGHGPGMPAEFRPGTHGTFFHSTVSINSKGFRGPEIPDEKGNTYRIVALGESTTFGLTLNEAHRPWPEQLEQLIRDRLKPARPVEVINAGIPAASIEGNLARLNSQILAVKPDMIISYHGLNGFYLLDSNLPPNVVAPPPRYQTRPLRLLADLEYGLKLNHYKQALIPRPVLGIPPSFRPMETDYAKAYEKLIHFAEAHEIRLVLANYSMAVNAASDPALIQFYGQIEPRVRGIITANEAHSEIVRELAKEHAEITFVDTHPRLDGVHDDFIDLVHFAPPGDQRMAEIFFAGISNILAEDLLGQPPSQPEETLTPELENYALDFTTPTDPALQAKLEAIDATIRAKYGMTTEQTAVGLLDLRQPRLALIHADRMVYGASIPKVSILLTYFQQHPEAATNLNAQTRHELGLMAKASNNEMATKFSQQLGLKQIEDVILAYHLYDTNHGGGIWFGKHYGRSDERIGDPLSNLSHAATVRQLLRYFLLLEQGKLVSPAASKTMREIFASPEIPFDDFKFVKGLRGRNLHIIRKWGEWDNWHHDAAVVTGPGRHYVLVALTEHPSGDDYLADLAGAVDDLMNQDNRSK